MHLMMSNPIVDLFDRVRSKLEFKFILHIWAKFRWPPRSPRYKIEHAVGAGHFTRAYLATDLETNTKAGSDTTGLLLHRRR